MILYRTTANLLYTVLLFVSCGFPLDTSSIMIKENFNPRKTRRAVLLENDENATVGYSLQVSIYKSSYKLSGKEIGNTFTVDDNHGASSLDSTSINFQWVSDDTLMIDYKRNLRTFIQEKSIEGVNILYKPR